MSADSSSRGKIQLASMPDSYDLDRGLLLSVQAIQVSHTVEKASLFSVVINLISTLHLPFP